MIIIKSKNIAVGKKLRCRREMSGLLTPGMDYDIVSISDDHIMMMDNEHDEKHLLLMSKDKDGFQGIFKYFIVF